MGAINQPPFSSFENSQFRYIHFAPLRISLSGPRGPRRYAFSAPALADALVRSSATSLGNSPATQPARLETNRGVHMATISASAASHLDQSALKFLEHSHRLLINGKWVKAASGRTFPTYN